MLKKFILIAGVFGTMATLSAVGCSSSSTSGNGAAGGDSGASKGDSGSKAKTDGGKTTGDGGTVITPKDGGTISHFDGGGSDGGPITFSDGGVHDAPACYDLSGAVTLTGVGAAVAHQNVCNATQISGYLAACLGSTATDAGCTTFMTANANCSTCIGGPSTATTGYNFPVLVPIDSSADVVANVEGCFAALSTGDATCKTNFPSLVECEQSACNTCSSDSDNTACLDYSDADTGGCPSFVPVSDVCNSAVATSQASGANQTACGAAAADFTTAYTAVATTLCGP